MHKLDVMVLGIDFGGTSVKWGLVDGARVLEHFEPLPTEGYPNAGALIHALVERIQHLQAQYPKLAGIGVGVPGFVYPKTGRIHQLTNVRGWQDVPLRQELEHALQLPVAVLNDANAMALAEWQFGAGQGCENLACLTLGTGVGGGLIVEGKLLQGHAGGAAEIGQTSIDYQGRMGVYGNRGCVEKYLGNKQLAQTAQSLYAEAGLQYSLEEMAPHHLARRAQQGCNIATQIWRDSAEQLACTIANVCWLTNPERIVIGGGVAQAGELLFEPLREFVLAGISSFHAQDLAIVPAHFGNDAGLIGAAYAGSQRGKSF